MAHSIKAVAFDLDGTLLDTLPDLASAVNAVRTVYQFPPLLLETVKEYVGDGAAMLVRRALANNSQGEIAEALFEQAFPLFLNHYQQHLTQQTLIYPDVLETLQQLTEQGLLLACITNKPARFTLPLLDAMGLSAYFKLILSGDSLPRKKPDPLPLLHACQSFALQPPELLMVGDSMNDWAAAQTAGCPVCIVNYGYLRTTDNDNLMRTRLINRLAELAKFMNNRTNISDL